MTAPRVLSILGLALSTIIVAASAHADEWGDTESNPIDGTGPRPDRSSHTYCFEPMNTSVHDNIVNAENNALDAETQVTVAYQSSCDYSSGTETDVVWDTADLSGTVRGRAWCEDWDDGLCDQSYVELDVAELNEGSNDEVDTTKTACHELGHTVGLTHHSSGYGCLISGEVPSTDLMWRRYVDHHKGHINDWF